MSAALAPESLSASRLDAIAALWRRERRELVTSFEGVSMRPAIEPGQRVVVDCGAAPEVGKVVLFRFCERVGVHRVVARTDSWVMTWGDANALPDEPVEPAAVVGVLRDVPAAPRRLRRALLLRWLAVPNAPIESLARRVRLLHRVRNAWAPGPLAFAGKAVRSLLRPLFPH